jgi:hypothetical protein
MQDKCLSDKFHKGLDVYYHKQIGKIQFVCDNYIVICTARTDSKIHDVCLLVYPENYQYITLFKQSQK